MTYPVHICSFQALPDAPHKVGYRKFKDLVLEVGRFSVFEATRSQATARMFDRLCKDPEIETFDMGFPWTGVRRHS